MLEALPPSSRELLATVGRLADGGAWLVGGPVRDLILGRELVDLDLCVEQPAGELADRLSRELGGTVLRHAAFGTASWRHEDLALDLATTRRESYREPAALPQVEAAGIDEDLARRDFTVNAMALSLAPQSWGELLDPYEGRTDLERRRLRVLHERSFIDDPTRAFRGVRFAVRLGFELVRPTPGDPALLSPARFGRELRLIFGEPHWDRSLALVEAHALLDWSAAEVDWGEAEAVAGGIFPDDPATFGLLALLVAAPADRRDACATRIEARRILRKAAATSVAAERGLALVQGRPSAIQLHDLLGSFDPAAIHALALRHPAREALEDYLARRRRAAPRATSRQLRELGVPEGPPLGHARAAIERARIERPELTLEEELAIARELA